MLLNQAKQTLHCLVSINAVRQNVPTGLILTDEDRKDDRIWGERSFGVVKNLGALAHSWYVGDL